MYIALEVLRHQFIVDNSTPTICCSFIHECASSVWCWKGVIYDLLLCFALHYSIKNPLNFDSFVIIVNKSASVPAHCWIFNGFASNWNFFLSSKNLKYVAQKSLCASTCNMIHDSKMSHLWLFCHSSKKYIKLRIW